MVVDRMRNFSYNPLSIGWGFRNKWQKRSKLITFQSNSYLFSSNLFLHCLNNSCWWWNWPFSGLLTFTLYGMLFLSPKKSWHTVHDNLGRKHENEGSSKPRSDMRFVTSRVCKVTIGNCSPDQSWCSSGPFRPRSRRSRTCCSAPWR